MQAKLARFVTPKPSPMPSDLATEIDNGLRLFLSRTYDVVTPLLPFLGSESAVYDFFKLVVGELFERWLKENLREAATQFLKQVFVDGLTRAEAYSQVKQKMKQSARLRSFCEQEIIPRFNSIIDHLSEVKRSLVNLVNEKSNELSVLNDEKKAQAEQFQKFIENCKKYLTAPSQNTSAESEMKAFFEKYSKQRAVMNELSEYFDSDPGKDTLEQLRRLELQLRPLSQKPSIYTLIRQSIKKGRIRLR